MALKAVVADSERAHSAMFLIDIFILLFFLLIVGRGRLFYPVKNHIFHTQVVFKPFFNFFLE